MEFDGNLHINNDYGTDESEVDNLEESQPAIQDYQLVRDREMRQSKAPHRFGYADLIAYAISVTHELNIDEPNSYKEAILCDQRDNWIRQWKHKWYLYPETTLGH